MVLRWPIRWRGLAASLSATRMGDLAEALGQAPGVLPQGDNVHPAEYYLMPALPGAPSVAGDIHVLANGDFRILLTPSCDLIQKKNEFTLWAECVRLSACVEYQNWLADNSKEGALRALLKNNRNKQPDRYFFLPGAYAVPDLVVDFERLLHTPFGLLDAATRVASLDSPFAELLLSRFARFLGRLGTPDLDAPLLISRLKAGVA